MPFLFDVPNDRVVQEVVRPVTVALLQALIVSDVMIETLALLELLEEERFQVRFRLRCREAHQCSVPVVDELFKEFLSLERDGKEVV